MQREEEKIYQERCRLFGDRIKNDRFDESMELQAVYSVSKEPVPFEKRLELDYKPLHVGDRWGEKWESAWVHISMPIPENWRKQELALQLNFSGEALIFDSEGCPVYAVTGASNINPHYFKDQYILPESMTRTGNLDVWIELAGNSIFGLIMDWDPDLKNPEPDGTFDGIVKAMSLCRFNREAWQLSLDYYILYGIFETFPAEDYRRKRLLDSMNRIVNVYAENSANASAARAIARKELSIPAFSSALTAYTVGHAHIDTAWLWPVRETIRKCARTYANQIDLIEKYPDYIFGASAPQHYAFVKKYYPKLYAKVKKAVAAGRWEPQGGMWVEADCNITSGEAMVRQFLHGKNFFMDEFGFDVKNLWIPDVFGYSAAMPQIIKKAGCRYFLTQKISWNKTNRFPYHTFMWRGIDGTEILTHFPPADTYNWLGEPSSMAYAQNRYHESVQTGAFLNLMGIGDGGGGPAEEHVERAKRLENIESMPRVKFKRADAFFEEIAKSEKELPCWNGELYLEMHRGTLTTQAKTKRGNRKCEQMLAAVEFLYSCLPPEQYPAEELDYLWKLLMLNQFHDILPGSSITKVYEVTEKEHAEILTKCQQLIDNAGALLPPDEDSITVLNTLSYDFTRPVELPAAWSGHAVLNNQKELPVQLIHGKPFVRVLLKSGESLVLKRGAIKETASAANDSGVLENEFIRYRFDANGMLIEAFDKQANRSVLKQGRAGNSLDLYTDRPTCFEAWDIETFYREQTPAHAKDVKLSKIVSGELGSALEITGKIGEKSAFTQQVFLAKDSKRLDFHTVVEWHEARKMLRVSFPVDVFAAEGSFDIQYGYVKRPLYANTSWDVARFEVAAQRYMDISEREYGAALLNDCKYGYRCDDTGLDLCLLRSPKQPDWNADQGHQEFTYTFFPHCGDLVASDVMKESAMLNRPPLTMSGAAGLIAAPAVLNAENVTLEVVKKAEKSNTWICRMVETAGKPGTAELILNQPVSKVSETDLMEWNTLEDFPVTQGKVLLKFKPFEIKTIRLE